MTARMSSRSLYSLPTRRSASVHGDGSVRASYASTGPAAAAAAAAPLGGSEKLAMQNLNDRLAAYLNQVRALEASNGEWERKIREWLEKKSPDVRDYSKYEAVIADLRNKISAATKNNARLMLDIDNSNLAASDFKYKLENEKNMRTAVESDILGLRRTLDDLTMTRSDLEMQLEGLTEELAYLKKSHAEELAALRNNVSGSSVNVEVDAKPQEDLNRVLEDVRRQYNGIAEKNRQEMDAWYKAKFDDLNKKMASSTETLQTSRSEINDLKRTLQALQIELQSQLSLKAACEGTLAETEGRYNNQLSQLQARVNALEVELSQMKADIERQALDYQTLLNIKTRLQMEIAEYRRLLDGEDQSKSVVTASKTKTEIKEEKPQTVITQRTRVVIEKIVDGKVVSREEQPGTEIIKK